MTRAFVDGMSSAGANNVTIIDVIDLRIAYCTGCFACKHNGGEYILDDDMKDILTRFVSDRSGSASGALFPHDPGRDICEIRQRRDEIIMQNNQDGKYLMILSVFFNVACRRGKIPRLNRGKIKALRKEKPPSILVSVWRRITKEYKGVFPNKK